MIGHLIIEIMFFFVLCDFAAFIFGEYFCYSSLVTFLFDNNSSFSGVSGTA